MPWKRNFVLCVSFAMLNIEFNKLGNLRFVGSFVCYNLFCLKFLAIDIVSFHFEGWNVHIGHGYTPQKINLASGILMSFAEIYLLHLALLNGR